MPKDRSFVRASDIGAWSFCNRAWWLAHMQKVPHERPELLDWGEQTHSDHGRIVSRSEWLQKSGFALMIGGVGLLGAYWLIQLFW